MVSILRCGLTVILTASGFSAYAIELSGEASSPDYIYVEPNLPDSLKGYRYVGSSFPQIEEGMSAAEEIVMVNKECKPKRLAIKTNLLYDAILAPSLELEYKFNPRWSLGIEGTVAWWSNDNKHKYYQVMNILPEVRYHFNPNKDWGGNYLGIFAGGGKYDLENGGKGYQGEQGMLGLSYNYVWQLRCNFAIEAGLGVGVMFTRYKKYYPENGKYVYRETKNLWYGGPLRAKVALVWYLWNR